MMGLFIRIWLPAGEIIGGHPAKAHSRPYMAFLEIQNGRDISICGGFLVSKDFVLTAAHCKADKITVKLGAHNIKNPRESRQEIPVRRQIIHRYYNSLSQNNDIMLLQLERKAILNEHVSPIRLPLAHQQVLPGTMCSVAGWGRISTANRQISAILQEVDLMVMKDAACHFYHYNSTTMLCAGDPEKGKSSFKGDSGGPLVCGGTAQGIVSFGSKDGTPPAVYTRVSTFIPWIQEEMRKLRAEPLPPTPLP
uniref:Peptidase S1 domain-containing protein n=1 Tax=Pelusios castaneus TaxID=367368 RepID=A0A8C8S1W4_9SAUR